MQGGLRGASRRGIGGVRDHHGAPYHAALRLFAYFAANFAEIDGRQLKSAGRGVKRFTPREACNLALVLMLDSQQDEEAREVLMDELYDDGTSQQQAMDQLRQHMEATGMWGGGDAEDRREHTH
jgi:hypothetical protein